MCGIVGYIGTKDAEDLLLTGLKRLEYRGYDSAGLAIFEALQARQQKVLGVFRPDVPYNSAHAPSSGMISQKK